MPVASLAEINALTPVIISGLNLKYRETVENEANWEGKFTFPETADAETVTLDWLYDTIRLEQQAIGQPPTYQKTSGFTTTLALEQWGVALKLKALDVAHDRTGKVLAQAQEVGLAAARFAQDRIIDALNNGDSSSYPMYDSQNYFSNSHTRNGNAYDNLRAGTLSSTNLQAMRVVMAQFPTDKNEPSNLQATDLFVPMELDFTARQIINNSLAPEDNKYTENVLKGIVSLHANAEFTDANDWFLMHTGSGMTHKPFVNVRHSTYGDLKVYPELEPNSDAFKLYKEFRWWAFMMKLIYPTHPFFAIKVVN
jgi:hypothetical protein